MRLKLFIFLLIALAIVPLAYSATELVFAYPPNRCQSDAAGLVGINSNDTWTNFYGYCIQYSPNIQIREPVLGYKWYWSKKNNVYLKWMDLGSPMGIVGVLHYNDIPSSSGVKIYPNNVICFGDFANARNLSQWHLHYETQNIPHLLDYPRESGSHNIWAAAWWCNDVACSTPQWIGNISTTIPNEIQSLEGCKWYIEGVNPPFDWRTEWEGIYYGGCYFNGCNLIFSATDKYNTMPSEMVVVNSTIQFYKSGITNVYFQPEYQNVSQYPYPNKIYFENVRIKSLDGASKSILLQASNSNITMKNIICDYNPYGDFKFSANRDIYGSYLQTPLKGQFIIITGVGHSWWNPIPQWRLPTNLNFIDSPNAGCVRLRMYDTQPYNRVSANLNLKNSNIWRLELIEDGGTWNVENTKVGDFIFWSNRTSGWYPLLCSQELRPLRVSFLSGDEAPSTGKPYYYKLPKNCPLTSSVNAQSNATLDANGNTLSCNDKFIFGWDTIQDNVLYCAARSHYVNWGEIRNAVIKDTPLEGLRIYPAPISGGYRQVLSNVKFDKSVAWLTPQLYPNWTWWSAIQSKKGYVWNYSFLDVQHLNQSNLFFDKVKLYDTYRIFGGFNVTGISIIGCTGRLGSFCGYVKQYIPYEPVYTPNDFFLITGDIIGRALLSARELIPILIFASLFVGLVLIIRFKLKTG